MSQRKEIRPKLSLRKKLLSHHGRSGLVHNNRYLDGEYVRRLADGSLRLYAHNLLHFVRRRPRIHHTGDVLERDLTESTLLE